MNVIETGIMKNVATYIYCSTCQRDEMGFFWPTRNYLYCMRRYLILPFKTIFTHGCGLLVKLYSIVSIYIYGQNGKYGHIGIYLHVCIFSQLRCMYTYVCIVVCIVCVFKVHIHVCKCMHLITYVYNVYMHGGMYISTYCISTQVNPSHNVPVQYVK